MASRSLNRAFRVPLARQSSAPVAQRRMLFSAAEVTRTAPRNVIKVSTSSVRQHARGFKTIDFAGTKEKVYGTFNSLHV
jgi:ketol-acid reductoisomerase